MTFLFLDFLVGFFLGGITVIGLEVLVVWSVIRRLTWKNRKLEEEFQAATEAVVFQQPLDFVSQKEGYVWVLEAERVQKNWLEKVSLEHDRKKKFFEVTPVRKHAMIKNHQLLLSGSDGSPNSIHLKECLIEAVSATDLPSRKWAKRFPIKVESKTSGIYKGSKMLYIYLETNWDKESWCKALRYASTDDKTRHVWLAKLQKEFKSYVMSLYDGYHSFMRPQGAFCSYAPTDRENGMDASSSKIRQMMRRLSRKSKEKKMNGKCRSCQDSVSTNGSLRDSNCSIQRSFSQFSTASDGESEDRTGVDEGTLCWNLLISRFFFDIKSGQEIRRAILERIQRTLFNMRTPSYIGEVICTNVDTGSLPPNILSMRVLPMEMNDVWAFEIDVEYRGGLLLEFETRIEVRDLELQRDGAEPNQESTSDLVEGSEKLGELKDEGMKGNTSSALPPPAPNSKFKWKSIVNSIAKHVSQVPLSMRVKVASLRGTLRLHIKPPPSDQLWYCFTSMPEIDFNLESSLGDHKITNGHVAMFIVNRFKAAIREKLVHPNCESICIPFMLAEKSDWVPRKSAPFIWLNHEHPASSAEPRTRPESQKENLRGSRRLSTSDIPDVSIPTASDLTELHRESKSLEDLTAPLLIKNESFVSTMQEQNMEIGISDVVMPRSKSLPETINSFTMPPRSISLQENSTSSGEDDTRRHNKVKLGKRARMLSLKKRMGEKIEEKGRHLVEKMKGT